MSPYERMAAKYAANPQELPFEAYEFWHKRHGFIFSTPDFFIMGRDVIKQDDHDAMLSFVLRPPRKECNCWYIHSMAGDMNKAWSILPWYLPWIAFERVRSGKRELTILPFEQIKRLTMSTTKEAGI